MAVSFDGANTKAEGTIPAINSGDWTWIGWAYPTGAGEANVGALFFCQTSPGVNCQRMAFNAATLVLVGQQAGTTNATTVTTNTLTANNWYCLATTFRASDGKCRVFIGTPTSAMAEASYSAQTVLATRTTGGTDYTVGNKHDQSNTWAGTIGPNALDTREWSLAEMEQFRFWGRPVRWPTLRGFWPMYGTEDVEPDLTGQGVTLTLTSAAAATGPPLYGPPGLVRPRPGRFRR